MRNSRCNSRARPDATLRALGAAAVLAIGCGAGAADHDPSTYPLDAPVPSEYARAIEILEAAGRIDADTRFVTARLAEPGKAAVLAWQPGQPLERQVFFALLIDGQINETVVDLEQEKIISWRTVPGARPPLLGDDFILIQRTLRSNGDWQAALRRRGIENPKRSFCFPSLPGYFGIDDGRRLAHVNCYDTGGDGHLWGRPLTGLMATVDLDTGALVEITEGEIVPVPSGEPAVAPDQPAQLPASGPAQSRIQISGSWIEWDRWRLHLRLDPRVGPVISRVSVRDGDEQRTVLYQGTVSEMFVPYMDPAVTWYYRTYLDVGEYGIGSSGVPLTAGRDCPADAHLVDGTFVTARGEVEVRKGLACVFERITGDVAWSHFSPGRQRPLQRRHAELVLRFVVWLGNYDYVLDWIFTETGEIRIRVGTTGIVQVKAVPSRDLSSPAARRDLAHGRLISPHTVAVNHDHFFNFRLDLDIDAPQNSVTIDRLRRVELDADATGTHRREIWQSFGSVARSESQAQLSIDLRAPAIWRVVNQGRQTPAGYPASYQLMPEANARPLVTAADWPQRRAAFTEHQLWVTPYRAEERYAAGTYPNQHAGDAGLPSWTRADRSIEDTDIVLWYTLGLHHVVRSEDWPIMPLVDAEFSLRPFDFFEHNPTVD